MEFQQLGRRAAIGRFDGGRISSDAGGLLLREVESRLHILKRLAKDCFRDYRDKAQLPAHLLREVRRFFEDYKVLENKQVVVEDLLGPQEAIRVIRESLDLYRKLRRGELMPNGEKR